MAKSGKIYSLIEEILEDVLVDLVLFSQHVLVVLDGLEAKLHEDIRIQ